MKRNNILLILSSVLLVACTPTPPAAPIPTSAVVSTPTQDEEALTITSTAFAEGEAIPEAYRSGPIFGCDGEDISPLFSLSGVPAGTQSLALIMADVFFEPSFVHWAIYNLPATSTGLAEGVPHEAALPDGSLQGTLFAEENIGYFGPCPPPGETHTYLFLLYALDIVLDLEAGVENQDVLDSLEQAAAEGHVLAQAELTATYTGQ